MNKLKIYNILSREVRTEWDVKNNEKVIIKGEKAFILPKSFTDITNLEKMAEIEAPFYLEHDYESFMIE